MDEKYRGNGYGRKMVKVVLEELRKLQAEEAWLTGKIPRFYEKFGFEVVDWIFRTLLFVGRYLSGTWRKLCLPAYAKK